MRLWSLHPRYLDAKGLVALWREALLAQAVLRGQTRGYTHHPQLIRFQKSESPLGAIATYLRDVQVEATRRGYAFDKRRIGRSGAIHGLVVTSGQLNYEWRHLRMKLAARDPAWLKGMRGLRPVEPHPLFSVAFGPVETWERVPGSAPAL